MSDMTYAHSRASAELTERRKSDRAELASLVIGMAERYGLSAVVLPRRESEHRSDVSITGPHGLSLTVAFDGNSPHRPAWDTHVLSWHGVGEGWRLRLGKFSSINPHHGHKATDVTRGSGELITLLERRFAAIADGSAFEAAS